MIRLPHSIHFNDMDHPELLDVFSRIDAGIAAIIASDPSFRPKPAGKRRKQAKTTAAGAKALPRRQRAAA